MKKLLVPLSLMLVLVIGFALTANRASAINSNARTAAMAESNISIEETPSSPAVQVFQELNKKGQAKIGEGWLYMRQSDKVDVDPPKEEGVVPLIDTTMDGWYYINAKGFAERFVTITRTMDGQIQQVGIYSDGTTWNTMVDETEIMEPFFFENFNYGLPYGFKSPDFKSNNIALEDGSEAVLFTYTLKEEDPYYAFDYSSSARVEFMSYEYIFDSDTGFFVSLKQTVHFEDDSQRVLSYILLEEIKFIAEPPADVLKYFDLKKTREEQK
ncbi:MAG: hypothetical protein HZB18_18675 [Chloroflexi bacterium]|nr:hypothetical protein [Chloroflexota bacterium]